MAVERDPDDEREARIEQLARRPKDANGEDHAVSTPQRPNQVPAQVRLKPDRRKQTR